MLTLFATMVCFLCIYYLFKVDREKNDDVSGAVWIPLIWMYFSGSRFASQWLNLGSPESVTSISYSEGSPLDRNIFLFLILAGVWVLWQRKLDWLELFRRNMWIWLFFIYALISIFWSDDAIVSFKRWVKGVGNLVMALVIMTEQRPYEALGITLRRLGFLLVPLSVLFIRFYPDLGRAYHMGEPMFTGVCVQKNSLGQLLVILGTYYCWELVVKRKSVISEKRVPSSVFLIMLPMILWLLYMAHSATAVACVIIVLSFLLFCRLPAMVKKPQRILGYGLVTILLFELLDITLDIKDNIIRMLGREPDLTDRTPVWNMVLDMVTNPLIGAGYESFWSGNRLIDIWARMGVSSGGIIQAHNGYIEIYLNLGIVGLVLLIGTIIDGFIKTQKQIKTESEYAILRISFIIMIAINNYTEATYKPLSYYFVLLLAACMEVQNRNNSLRQLPLKMVLFSKEKHAYKSYKKSKPHIQPIDIGIKTNK
jgi:O-antigen ligase